MGKKVLVIGGTYFYGRVFSMLASREAGFELTLINRGKYSMDHLPCVTEYRADRHDAAALAAIPAGEYDAIVDFCAYAAGEVRFLLENLRCTAKKYILISTADVCQRGLPQPPDENAPLLAQRLPGPVGDYLWNKILLERELAEVCAQRGMSYTVFRPAFLYGPYNYAPRERYFFEKIIRGEAVECPTDADARFQFIYVKDAANAIIADIAAQRSENAVYHLAAPEQLDYAALFDVFRRVCDRPVITVPVTVDAVIAQNIALPFPLTAAESELFDGSRVCRELGLRYTPIDQGMEKAYLGVKQMLEER